MGLQSVAEADIEAAEKEIFPFVFAGVAWAEIANTGNARAIIAEILAPFVWCQYNRNRAQYVAASGEVTKTATSYGVVSVNRMLRVWNEGCERGERLMKAYGETIWDEYEHLRFIAEIKI